MKLFDITLDGWVTAKEIESTCEMLSYGESESTEQDMPKYGDSFNCFHGVPVFYDCGADYYFFEDTLS